MTRSRDPRTPAGKARKAATPSRGRGDAARRPAPASRTAAARAGTRAGAKTVSRTPKTPPKGKAGGKSTGRKSPPPKKVATKRVPPRPPRPAAKRPGPKRPAAKRAPLRVAPRPARPVRVRAASPQRRLVVLLVIMGLALGAIVVRLIDVQAVEGAHYEAMAEAQTVRTVDLAAERGTIFDRNGNELALSVPQQTVYADPRVIKDPDKYARKLAPIVDEDRSDLRDRLAEKQLAFVYVARKVDDRTAAKVKKLGLPGVGFVKESKRFYPAGSLAGPVLGFAGTDNEGLTGLERKYEKLLRGKPGRLVAEEDPSGREIPATQRTADAAERGGDLVLTIDQSLQYEVEKQLLAQVNGVSARGGVAIVADTRTGDVLAMASVAGGGGGSRAELAPATDPNRPLTSIYEPGSTAKVITVAGALESNVVEPNTPFYVEPKLQIDDKVFHDSEYHRPTTWDVSEIVRRSSNVGVIHIAEKLGRGPLNLFQHAFGFGQKTPIDFLYESAGIMKEPHEYVSTDMGSIPIGYTTAVTPMQMLDVFTTIANGGVSRPPRLVAATIDAEGTRREHRAEKGRRVVSAQTAAEVNLMLQGVVREGGTGEKAAISGYTVAGKTGTSRKPPYEPTPRYMASFAGFAPAENPRLAAIVVIDQPGTSNQSYYGGKVAAPLFASIMKYALRLEQIAPTGEIDSKASVPGPVMPPKPAPVTPAPTAPPAVPVVPPSAPPPAAPVVPNSTPPPGNVAAPAP